MGCAHHKLLLPACASAPHSRQIRTTTSRGIRMHEGGLVMRCSSKGLKRLVATAIVGAALAAAPVTLPGGHLTIGNFALANNGAGGGHGGGHSGGNAAGGNAAA